jgi:NAD-dependent SIR2 family protein deacetylase
VSPRKEPKKAKAYVKRHNKVYNARGSASTRKCVGCGKQAKDWSEQHDSPGTYRPRCRTCHRRYDLRRKK